MNLPIGRVTSRDSLEYWKFSRFVSSANLKSAGNESKNMHGKDDVKLCPSGLFPSTRSSSLSHWLNPRCSSNTILIFANAVKHCSNLYVVLTIGL